VSVVSSIDIRPGYRISTIVAEVRRLHGVGGIADMIAAFDAGVTTFDIGNLGAGAELIMGAFLEDLRLHRGNKALRNVVMNGQIAIGSGADVALGRDQFEAIIDRSLMRLGVERLDLVQLQWPNNDHPGFLDALAYLSVMQRRGKIGEIGVSNIDHHHLRMVLRAGVDIVSAKTPCSLIDRRSQGAFAAFCHQNNIAILAADLLVGGFLSDPWLGANDPGRKIISEQDTGDGLAGEGRRIIETFGGWSLFQELLMALQSIAKRHGTTIDDIALRAIHDHADPAAITLNVSRVHRFITRLQSTNFATTQRDREVLAQVLRRREGLNGGVFNVERGVIGKSRARPPAKLRVSTG